MTLPVSKYEELLETVRSLKHQTIRVRELASPLLDTIINANSGTESATWGQHQGVEDASVSRERSSSAMDSLLLGQRFDEVSGSHHSEPGGDLGDPWPGDRAMWHSEPPRIPCPQGPRTPSDQSVMSFASSSGAAPLDLVLGERGRLDVKVDMVYGLLAALGSGEEPDMADTLLALSASPDSSRAMRQAGCLPVLVQLLHARDPGGKAARALRNLVQGQPDERLRKRELKVLRLLEDIRAHCFNNADTEEQQAAAAASDDETVHPTQATENLIKLSFDEGYRHTICELGGIYTLARLLEAEHARHGAASIVDRCVTLRRYAGMALTNLTFGHGRNKALLCAQPAFLRCLVAQLDAQSDELRQVTASVLRNLSWRADAASRAALRQAGVVPALTIAAMRAKREPTLKAILSALWNLSAHCSTNKADICAVSGALGYLVDMLAWRAPSRTLHIAENAGGILRNVSSHIAVREDYRAVLRERGALPLLLQQLKSPSLTVVANACGTLWNLSAKCERDQRTLWELGAAPMLRSLNHSKHAMIATGSRAALKNLLASRPPNSLFSHVDSTARELGLPALPTLGARKQRALAKDLDSSLSETCENIEPTSPPPPVASAQPSPVNPTQQLVESLDKLSLRDCAFELEQPVDYSMKYAEPKPSYAETDLDQDQDHPTDYSLRYAENDAEQEEPDTIKTYCTEGTPYETPCNFSTATSMSDLRQVSTKPEAAAPPEKKPNSGLVTPEKPVKYCEEGTPRCVSPSPRSSDTKVVTFSPAAATAAEETPLMFSRCSSLGSLSSAEQHSIHDDRSSVISDFSRLTSGVVSPSELPDSPTQTVPPSPRARKAPVEVTAHVAPVHPAPTQPRSVFEDNVIKFKEVNTPVEFSANTSLSALTIDDEPPPPRPAPVVSTPAPVPEPADVVDADADVDEQAEDDMLAACINIGMQNNRLRQKKQQSSPRHRRTGIPVKAPNAALMGPAPDYIRTYCTEDTPAVLSHAGSRSDLSILSMGAELEPELSDDSSNLSGDQNDMLAECIQSGMPAAKPGSRVLHQRIFKTAAALAPAAARDEVNRFAVEDSPCHFSLRSSLSDLTVDREAHSSQPPPRGQPQPTLSRADSMSSLSSTEHAEQALLEQCISSGMPPKSKNAIAAGHPASSPAAPVTAAATSTGPRNIGYEENLLGGSKKNSPDAVDKCSELLAGSVEDNCSPDASDSERSRNRMLDPDAMIESLDRFTAELVSQSSHLPQHDVKLDNVDTWNDDTSPNDVSFPSLSVSAPLALAASFPSDVSGVSPDPLTASTLIALEAARLAADMQMSIELEHTKPPSVMDSLVSLTSSVSEAAPLHEVSVSARNSPVAGRKRSIPAGLLVRRALSHSASNLDHVQPPSIMAGDFLDLVDMENSMLSVASITSEVADLKLPEPEHDPDPEPSTETLCSETDVWEECVGSEVTLTEWSDAASASPTPIPSSTENSPRRRVLARLTPKQRRQLAKERYKTYTVAAEMVIREEYKSSQLQLTQPQPPASPDTTSNADKSSSSSSYVTARPTPKERRQADRARFQTRVLRKDGDGEDLHAVLAAQAALVLDTLRSDELLDCETVSLVSNEDDSEHNSVSSVNYRTYHKSWGFSKNLPVVRGETKPPLSEQDTAPSPSHSPSPPPAPTLPAKPKIVKPEEKPAVVENAPESNTLNEADVEQPKAVRGRRKPLYAGASSTTKKQIPTSRLTKPIKTMTSNLVKNVTSTLKTTSISKLTTPKPSNIKKPQTPVTNNNNKAGKTQIAAPSKPTSAATTKSRIAEVKKRPATAPASPALNRALERQGTFTKEDKKPRNAGGSIESRIPTPGRRAAPLQSRTVSSSAGTSRSPSADRARPRTLHGSASSQSLVAKRSSLPAPPPRSNSHVEPTSSSASRTATSRIAGIWKRNNNNTASSTTTTTTVRMRNKNSTATQDPPKRLSRLGSFIQVEEIPVT